MIHEERENYKNFLHTSTYGLLETFTSYLDKLSTPAINKILLLSLSETEYTWGDIKGMQHANRELDDR